MKDVLSYYRFGAVFLLIGLAVAGVNYYAVRLGFNADIRTFLQGLGTILSAIGLVATIVGLTIDGILRIARKK